MPTPVSVLQINKLLELLGNPSGLKFQAFLDNGDLLRLMVDADLPRVNRLVFNAALISTSPPIEWRPVGEYADKITKWSEMRHWDLSNDQINDFAASLIDHLDSTHPTGISLWLGHDLAYNWDEVMTCLKYEVEALGEIFTKYVTSDKVSFFHGSEQSGDSSLTVALLDLATYWDPINGILPDDVRTNEDRLPGLEVAWLLALNPHVFLAMDYETIPALIAAGLVVNSDDLIYFRRDPGQASVYDIEASRRWGGRSIVRFRK